MAWQSYLREDGISSALNWNPAKFQAGPIYELILAVQVEVFPEKLNTKLFLKVYLTKDLEVTDVWYGIGFNVLRMEFEEV